MTTNRPLYICDYFDFLFLLKEFDNKAQAYVRYKIWECKKNVILNSLLIFHYKNYHAFYIF